MTTKLLAVTDGGAPTGLSRVARNILSRLSPNEYDIHHLATNYFGDPHDEPWSMYAAVAGGDLYGYRRLSALVERLQPDVVFLYNDLWIQQQYLRILRECGSKSRIVLYSPVEAPPVDREWLADLEVVSTLVVFSRFARAEVLKALGQEYHGQIRVIPHGVDTTTFRVLEDKDAVRAALGLISGARDGTAFLVLNANRNQPRKRMDLTVAAFARFAVDKPPNVKLYLHTAVEGTGWNVLKLARRFGVEDRLVLTAEAERPPGISDDNLNRIYNACDIGVNTAVCEGWGLVSFEHAATCAAQVVPCLPSLLEHWNNVAALVPVHWNGAQPQTLLDGFAAAEEDIAACFDALYADTAYRADVARRCHLHALRPELRWDSIASAWDDVFHG